MTDLPPYKGQGQPLYTIDGRAFLGSPEAVNVKGYPSAGGRRLYTREHLERRGIEAEKKEDAT